jgi:hypothetical protein
MKIITNDNHRKVNRYIPSKRRDTMQEERMTTVKVSMKNRDRLAKLAKYGESLDDALSRLLGDSK